MQSAAICKNLHRLLQGTIFSSDLLLLPLGNVDIVLGVQWLNTLGRILFNFKHRSIEFVYKGKKHVLRGASTGLKVVKAKTLPKEGKLFMFAHVPQAIEVAQCHNIQAIQSEGILPSFASLISHYSCLFELPTTLPPHRNSFDYRIPLIDKNKSY